MTALLIDHASVLCGVALHVCRLLLPFLLPFGGTAFFNGACLLPPSAAALFVTSLLKWERRMQGLSAQTLWTPATDNSQFSAGHAMVILALDVLLYAALTWWGDKVRVDLSWFAGI
jgi:hypothetical protein